MKVWSIIRDFLFKRICFFYFFIAFLIILTSIFIPYSTHALSEAKLYDFSQKRVFFYNPSDCDPIKTNGIYKGAQYSFNDEQLKRLWWAASSENSMGVDTELSFFANIYEKGGGNPGNNDGLINKITERYYHPGQGWFASAAGEAYVTGRIVSRNLIFSDPTTEQIALAKDILNNGNRTIPPEIDEHDSIGDIVSAHNNGTPISINDKSQYISGTTIIKNKYNASYTFFTWANGEKKCSENCGDPFGYTDSKPQSSYSTTTSSLYNTLYNGQSVLSPAELQQIENNKKVYQLVATEYNIPWQLIAAIHYMEHNLQVTNPDNGQGIYQLYSYTAGGTNEHRFNPSSQITEAEFLAQTKLAAGIIRNKIGNLDLNNSDNVKRALFEYNGAANNYKKKAIDMGFTTQQANNGEGSPYVMNKYDAKRDPSSSKMSQHWPGMYVGDSQFDASATQKRPGAYTIFIALGGNNNKDEICANTYSSMGELIANTALELSWDCNNASRCQAKNNPKPEYIDAMKATNMYGSWGGAPIGASCDQFVATVMRYSKADKNFNTNVANASGNYMLSHPELYMEINYDGSNPEVLMPGDIFSTFNGYDSGGHIWIYVEINGLSGKADASWNSRTGEHYLFANPKLVESTGRRYKVFRRIDS